MTVHVPCRRDKKNERNTRRNSIKCIRSVCHGFDTPTEVGVVRLCTNVIRIAKLETKIGTYAACRASKVIGIGHVPANTACCSRDLLSADYPERLTGQR
jgi:hypothetical protein